MSEGPDEVVAGFVDESTELVERVSDDIIDLEANSDPEVINRIFRAFHTIKGNSRMLGFTRLGDFTHKAEDLMSLVRNGDLAIDSTIVRALTRAVDVFVEVLEEIRETGDDAFDYAPVAKMIEEAARGKAPPPKSAAAQAPLAEERSAAMTESSPEGETRAAAGGSTGLKMLVAEDDFASRLMLAKFLGRFGEAHVAVNGAEAVEGVAAACREGEPYRFVCMDIMMPGIDGIEAVKRIRAIEREHGSPEAVIMMITALSDPQTIISCCYESGADYYIIKPLVFTQLESLMKRYNLIS